MLVPGFGTQPHLVSLAHLKKNYNTKIQNNYQKTGILLYCIIVFVVLFIMHILRNSQLKKLVSDLKQMEGEGSE